MKGLEANNSDCPIVQLIYEIWLVSWTLCVNFICNVSPELLRDNPLQELKKRVW